MDYSRMGSPAFVVGRPRTPARVSCPPMGSSIVLSNTTCSELWLATKQLATVHPILVGLTESHDQRKGWLAWRFAVDP